MSVDSTNRVEVTLETTNSARRDVLLQLAVNKYKAGVLLCKTEHRLNVIEGIESRSGYNVEDEGVCPRLKRPSVTGLGPDLRDDVVLVVRAKDCRGVSVRVHFVLLWF